MCFFTHADTYAVEFSLIPDSLEIPQHIISVQLHQRIPVQQDRHIPVIIIMK